MNNSAIKFLVVSNSFSEKNQIKLIGLTVIGSFSKTRVTESEPVARREVCTA